MDWTGLDWTDVDLNLLQIHGDCFKPSPPTHSRCGPWLLFQFLNLYTVGRTPWMGDQPVPRPLPTHKHRINAHRHSCFEWDSNVISQFLSLRPRGRPFQTKPHSIKIFVFIKATEGYRIFLMSDRMRSMFCHSSISFE
jgi:hypothetical protein